MHDIIAKSCINRVLNIMNFLSLLHMTAGKGKKLMKLTWKISILQEEVNHQCIPGLIKID